LKENWRKFNWLWTS